MSDIANEDNLDFESNPDLEIDILSLYTGEKDVYFQNREAVDRLEQESSMLAKGVLGANALVSMWALATALNPLISLAAPILTLAFFNREYPWRVRRLFVVAKSILDHFGDDNVVVTPRVKTDSAIIDLLVRMPDKRMFALMIRANQNIGVMWREDRQDFFVVRKGSTAKKDKSLSKAINTLETIYSLKKNKHPIVGKTSSERSAPLIKAIVLAPGAKIIARDDSPLWAKFGEIKVLKIQTTSVTYVVECEDLVKFLQPPEK